MARISRLLGVATSLTVCAAVTSSCSHPGGDQGRNMNATIAAIKAAVPKTASRVTVRSYPISWIQGCSQIPGSRSGWTPAETMVSFTDSDPADTVIRQIDGALTWAGWIRHDLVNTHGQAPVPAWQKPVRRANAAIAESFAVPAGTSTWVLSASWQPPGPIGQSCP